MSDALVIRREFHIDRTGRGRKRMSTGPQQPRPAPVARLARLMALAIHIDELVHSGQIASQAEMARLGQVSRARLTQIMNLTLLAPEIQEALLFLPQAERGKQLCLRQLQPIAAEINWSAQRQMWAALLRHTSFDQA